jgi:Arm DNA-binding domain
MAELLNVGFTYSCRTSFSNKEGKSPIVLRIAFRGERRDIFTGLYCFQKDWDASSKKLFRSDKSASSLNKNLEMILQSAKNSFDEMKFSRQIFTIDELVDKIKGIEEQLPPTSRYCR